MSGDDAAGDDSPDDSPRVTGAPPVGERRDEATLPVIPPSVPRGAVESDGRVGAVAYPYRVYELRVSVDRALLDPRRDSFVASVDRSRRLVLRADAFPEPEERRVEDVLVLPSELPDDAARERVEEAAFRWTLRKYSATHPPEIAIERTVDAYKLFWLARRAGGDVIVDSVRGTESPLEE